MHRLFVVAFPCRLAVFALNAQSVVIPKTLVRPFSSMNFWTPGASDLVTPMHASPQGRPTLTGVQAPGNQHHTLLEAVPPSPAVQALQARLNASKDANLPRTAEEIYGDRESSTFIQRRQVVRTVFNLLDRNFKGCVRVWSWRGQRASAVCGCISLRVHAWRLGCAGSSRSATCDSSWWILVCTT